MVLLVWLDVIYFYLFIINTVQTSIRKYISTDTDKRKDTFNTSMQHFSL